nr:TetR/AcrR family transcriptional regulator [Mesorhizobium sp.]
MRMNRAKAAENRDAVIEAASRLFRQHGFDGIGLKDLMEAAGLTQGAFYKQFASKQDLIAQASSRAFERAGQRLSMAAEKNPSDPLGEVVALYLSMRHRDERLDGCPAAALGAEAARQPAEVKASFEAGMLAYLRLLDRWHGEPDGAPSEHALATLSTMVGAIVLARAVNDVDLASGLLRAAANAIGGGERQ